MQEKPSFSFAGYVTAIAAALPTALYAGIGGAFVSAVAGSVGSTIVNVAFARAAQAAESLYGGEQQLEGVLDSSQLGNMRQEIPASVRFARQRVASIIVSLAITLATSGIVSMATNGIGINFYLGDPFSITHSSQTNTPTGKPAKANAQDSSQGDAPDASTFVTQSAPELDTSDLIEPTTEDDGTDSNANDSAVTESPNGQEHDASGDSTSSKDQDQQASTGLDGEQGTGFDDMASDSASAEPTSSDVGLDAQQTSAPDADA